MNMKKTTYKIVVELKILEIIEVKEFQIGDVVRLRSDSRINVHKGSMAIDAINKDDCLCVWHENGEPKVQWYNKLVLIHCD